MYSARSERSSGCENASPLASGRPKYSIRWARCTGYASRTSAHGRRMREARSREMTRDWKSEVRQTVLQCLLGGMVLGLVAFVCFHLGFKVAVSAFAFLLATVLLSLRVNFATSI